ncbi:hypothetical protein GFH48_36305 [Streptomyces fagopyri]|uniref:Uncharacterized protein n=1 Tax=Streptomyces fagopyri TaxID=2662397 RepID=A0A5Q0LLS9_9ACTN|nr:hypothetical protein GFH48_36305 [Streptomyces fagopyri]
MGGEIESFSGLSKSQFNRLVALVRRRGGDVQRGRPWRLPWKTSEHRTQAQHLARAHGDRAAKPALVSQPGHHATTLNRSTPDARVQRSVVSTKSARDG